ncbi:MAG: DsrE family protein [Chloroflexi bacterium]|nr:DsrE family protein [Chloroflexota bacterium]
MSRPNTWPTQCWPQSRCAKGRPLDPEDAKILIVMTSGPKTPERCAAPFFFAKSAAAQEADVSMFFTMQGTLLLKQGVAEQVRAVEGGRPISQFVQDTLRVGVKFYVCAASLELNGMTPDDLIEDVDNPVGSTFLITAGLEADLVLNF